MTTWRCLRPAETHEKGKDERQHLGPLPGKDPQIEDGAEHYDETDGEEKGEHQIGASPE